MRLPISEPVRRTRQDVHCPHCSSYHDSNSLLDRGSLHSLAFIISWASLSQQPASQQAEPREATKAHPGRNLISGNTSSSGDWNSPATSRLRTITATIYRTAFLDQTAILYCCQRLQGRPFIIQLPPHRTRTGSLITRARQPRATLRHCNATLLPPVAQESAVPPQALFFFPVCYISSLSGLDNFPLNFHTLSPLGC